MQQPTSGEQSGLFSPGVPNGYGGWEGSFGTPPIVYPDSTTGGELNKPKRKGKRKQHDMEQFQEYSLDTAAAAAAAASALNWTTAASSDPLVKDKRKENSSGARKCKRAEIETAVPWTEEMVQYLFETYDDVHRRLYIESRGKVKNQKKWDPIIKTMQERFHREFTKNQCESKYWKVRRECTKYKLRSEKKRAAAAAAAANEELYPGGKASIRELLKPKFYAVWLQVAAGENSSTMPEIEVSSASDEDDMMGAAGAPSEAPAAAAAPAEEEEEQDPEEEGSEEAHHHHHHHSSSCAIVREMQQLITIRLEASEKREEALSIRAELTMELLRQHMERMEQTGLSGDDARQRQLQMIEGVDNKLDRLVHGLSALNNNLAAIIGRLNPTLQR